MTTFLLLAVLVGLYTVAITFISNMWIPRKVMSEAGIAEIAPTCARMGKKSSVFDVCRNMEQFGLALSKIAIVPQALSVLF